MNLTRPILFALFVLLSVSLTATSAEQATLAEIFANTDRPVKVVCFGDSVTGLYYHTGGRRAYTDIVKIGLQRAFPKTKVEAINAGVSGNTAEQGLQRIQKDVLRAYLRTSREVSSGRESLNNQTVLGRAENHKPDLVTVMFSLNDMVRGKSLAAFEGHLLDIVRQCQAVGAAVLLCTPNSVMETPRRPIAKLETYVEAIRKFGKQHDLPVADCYAAFEAAREKDEWEWSMLLSDEIHPNMGGHKLIAETIVEAVSGKHISLADVAPLQPAIPFTLKRLQAGEPVKILAMPPYDSIVVETIHQQLPNAKLEVTPWEVAGLNIAEIEAMADQVRAGGYHLVIVAVPWEACPRKVESQLRSFSWVLNKSLSFGRMEWDCVAITPAVARAAANEEERLANLISRQFMRNQDLTAIDRKESQPNKQAKEIFADWWATQRGRPTP